MLPSLLGALLRSAHVTSPSVLHSRSFGVRAGKQGVWANDTRFPLAELSYSKVFLRVQIPGSGVPLQDLLWGFPSASGHTWPHTADTYLREYSDIRQLFSIHNFVVWKRFSSGDYRTFLLEGE